MRLQQDHLRGAALGAPPLDEGPGGEWMPTREAEARGRESERQSLGLPGRSRPKGAVQGRLAALSGSSGGSEGGGSAEGASNRALETDLLFLSAETIV